MATKGSAIVALEEMLNGQEADVFLLMTAKEELITRDGKPYFKVGFRGASRQVSFPIWAESAWSDPCRKSWTPGAFYKVRAAYRETSFGPQLDIRKIREVCDADAADGFESTMFLARSRFDPAEMFAELVGIARQKIADEPLRELVVSIMENHRQQLLELPAATRNHHCYVGGYLEHVLSVTRTALYFAEKYDDYYPDLRPRLNRDVVVAGAILHDIGKLREIAWQPEGAAYLPAGDLVGHILQGRDIVREAAIARPIDPELLLRLEHVIISHQRLPEWGSPKPPMTPEALLVHYADDVDAKYHMMFIALRDDANPGHLTSKQNQLHQKIYRGAQ